MAHFPRVCDAVLRHQVGVDVSSVPATRLHDAHDVVPSCQADIGVSSVPVSVDVDVSPAVTTRLHVAHVLVSRLHVAHAVVLTIRLRAAHVVLYPQVGIGVRSALTTRLHGAHAVRCVQAVQCRRRWWCAALQVPLAVL